MRVGSTMQPIEEVTLEGLGECVIDGGKPRVDSRDDGKHTGRNNMLFVEKMMWMDERV